MVEEITHAEGLERLRARWDRLLATCPHATPFHAPAWVLPWIATFGTGDLWSLAVWRGAELVGLAPLRIDIDRASGLRVVRFVAAGVSDYHGVVAEGGEPGRATLTELLDHLERRRARWDLCDFQQLSPDEPLADLPLPGGLAGACAAQEVCSRVTLPASTEALYQQLPRRLGPVIARCIRRLERTGRVQFECADASSIGELLDAFFRVHAARWGRRGLTGMVADATIQHFHRGVAAEMLRAGRLRLHGLRFDGELVAVVYAIALGARVYAYLGGFEPRLAPFSPGLVMLWQTMSSAIGEGIVELDFLRGEEEYKRRWGARERWNRRRLIRADERADAGASAGTGAGVLA
jgi:CelD/BcsL family acetyltransferase involved in cellulose biosynthesis